ncbi:MAG: phosphocholine cytidylyltransferase family protein [Lachnospiraceae bacterium]|nr:phosphocholine cytidylyltransferase family protein [Lachnospiraceae bacterium]
MKALILNSGIGKRMGELTKKTNKCMAEIAPDTTIIDGQLKSLIKENLTDVVITTGPFADSLEKYVTEKYKEIHFEFRNNPVYDSTNYIYSIALAEDLLRDDIILMHGDLVFEQSVLHDIINSETSAMVVDETLPLPEKDFKAVVENGKITKVGIGFFDSAFAAQPLYKLKKDEWNVWLENILKFCEAGTRSCYAENAMNEISDKIDIRPFNVNGRVCTEVDNLEDLAKVQALVKEKKMF